MRTVLKTACLAAIAGIVFAAPTAAQADGGQGGGQGGPPASGRETRAAPGA